MTLDRPRPHACVGLLLCEGDRVLLARLSSAESWYPDCWDVPGGHIEPGETALQALVREANEELAVVVDCDDAVLVDVVHGDDFELAVYSTPRWVGDVLNAAPEEHDEIAWFSVSEIGRTGARASSDQPPGRRIAHAVGSTRQVLAVGPDRFNSVPGAESSTELRAEQNTTAATTETPFREHRLGR